MTPRRVAKAQAASGSRLGFGRLRRGWRGDGPSSPPNRLTVEQANSLALALKSPGAARYIRCTLSNSTYGGLTPAGVRPVRQQDLVLGDEDLAMESGESGWRRLKTNPSRFLVFWPSRFLAGGT
jgi:hypothetical protein